MPLNLPLLRRLQSHGSCQGHNLWGWEHSDPPHSRLQKSSGGDNLNHAKVLALGKEYFIQNPYLLDLLLQSPGSSIIFPFVGQLQAGPGQTQLRAMVLTAMATLTWMPVRGLWTERINHGDADPFSFYLSQDGWRSLETEREVMRT